MLRGRAIVQGDEVEEFWALKDVSFEVQPGERVGIIGRNGANLCQAEQLRYYPNNSSFTDKRV